jgi:hypothetical protein
VAIQEAEKEINGGILKLTRWRAGKTEEVQLKLRVMGTYGTAAREAVPALKELIVALNEQCNRGEFPAGELNNRRVSAVEEAIKAIEAATTQPELRSIAPARPNALHEQSQDRSHD